MKIFVDGEDFEVCFGEEPFCEHCHNLEPYTAIFVDGCEWCLWCFESMHELPGAAIDKIKKIEKRHKKAYFKRKLEELENDATN